MLRHVDLCSGIGGFALGFEWAGLSKPVLFCDIEPFCRKVLRKHWPDVPIAEDVKELANDPDGLIPECDIITAGYPCQPFSVAGARRGTEDDRHIWPEIFSIIKAKRPTWTVFENVYGHISMGIDEVLSDLEGENYAVRPFVIPACAVDAPHRRDRVWIIGRNMGNAKHDGSSTAKIKRSTEEASDNNTERQIKTSKSKGASQSGNCKSMGASPRADNVGNTFGSRQHGINRRKSEQKPQNGCKDVANADSPHEQRGSVSGRVYQKHDHTDGNSRDGRSRALANAASLHGNGCGEYSQKGQRQEPQPRDSGGSDNVADSNDTRNRTPERRTNKKWQKTFEGQEKQSQSKFSRFSKNVADTKRKRQQGSRPQGDAIDTKTQREGETVEPVNGSVGGIWKPEPPVGRVAHGIPRRVDRLKGLGNAIVPQIAQRIGETIKQCS